MDAAAVAQVSYGKAAPALSLATWTTAGETTSETGAEVAPRPAPLVTQSVAT